MPQNESIWKYVLKIEDEQVIRLPRSSIILSVGEQEEELVVWVWLDVDTVKQPVILTDVRFSIRGTGHPVGRVAGEFLGTVQMTNGLTWHVFTSGRVRR